ncbi:MAG: NusG domain II-containing protein [Firmicutes bacterium]|nr:NusG domain II-containing protein [Bacillota bacterium]MDD3851273.1 NusG domain II-containing protein [Bacillota bacterium]MDD4706953.1 NusG domain II-containing protein [Bacillota bacterium]
MQNDKLGKVEGILQSEREDAMTRYDKVLILVLVVAAVFGLYYITIVMTSDGGNYAVIMVNGEEHSRIELKDAEPTEFTVTTPWGYNTVEVGNNRIRIKAASCPDQICVKEGWIERVNEMTVCMPNRVYIKVVGQETEIDDIAY